jgi:CsoR family transcriptional regulator, copper-sensing transcriptional repressor
MMMEKENGEAMDLPAPGGGAAEPYHHEHHQQVLNRLARIEGHVRAVKRMVEGDVPCPDVLIQIAAVRSALYGVGRLVLEDHLQSCMVEAVEKGNYQQALRDLKVSLERFLG